jgi:hypothetical protein
LQRLVYLKLIFKYYYYFRILLHRYSQFKKEAFGLLITLSIQIST